MFISFEGIEGSGKTTQLRLVGEYLKREGIDVLITAEPGGTIIGEEIRDILLNTEFKHMTQLTELLLYNASRSQHIEEVILPVLKGNKMVLTDRFSDSTIAYQGYGRGIDLDIIMKIDRIATMGLKPDLTILFDLDVREGLMRNRGINKVDRFELEDVMFHEKVRNGFLELSKIEPERFKIIDATMSVNEITITILKIIMEKANENSATNIHEKNLKSKI